MKTILIAVLAGLGLVGMWLQDQKIRAANAQIGSLQQTVDLLSNNLKCYALTDKALSGKEITLRSEGNVMLAMENSLIASSTFDVYGLSDRSTGLNVITSDTVMLSKNRLEFHEGL